MSNIVIWYSGEKDYRKNTILLNEDKSIPNIYTLELLDVDTDEDRTFYQMLADVLNRRQTKTVEVLYSGGLDSELILHSCLVNKIPVRAITLRLSIRGLAFNTHDLYYAEKFCREHNIEHKIIDFDVVKFYENGEHKRYLSPYLITEPHVATHFWLFEQCTGYPVFGGEYSWPQGYGTVISPTRLSFAQYERYLKDKGIHGIGSMLSANLEINMKLMAKHLELLFPDTETKKLSIEGPWFKASIYRAMGYTQVEPRFRNYGWDYLQPELFNKLAYLKDLEKEYGITNNKVVWNKKIGDVLRTSPGSNTKF